MTPSLQLWRVALGLHPWQVVKDVGASLADVRDASGRSCCARVDDVEAMPGGRDDSASLDVVGHWAVMVGLRRVPVTVLARWAAVHPTYLMDRRTGRLIRVPGGNVDVAAYMLASGWLHAEDALLTSGAVAERIAA